MLQILKQMEHDREQEERNHLAEMLRLKRQREQEERERKGEDMIDMAGTGL